MKNGTHTLGLPPKHGGYPTPASDKTVSDDSRFRLTMNMVSVVLLATMLRQYTRGPYRDADFSQNDLFIMATLHAAGDQELSLRVLRDFMVGLEPDPGVQKVDPAATALRRLEQMAMVESREVRQMRWYRITPEGREILMAVIMEELDAHQAIMRDVFQNELSESDSDWSGSLIEIMKERVNATVKAAH
jgi:hypothetical protein